MFRGIQQDKELSSADRGSMYPSVVVGQKELPLLPFGC